MTVILLNLTEDQNDKKAEGIIESAYMEYLHM